MNTETTTAFPALKFRPFTEQDALAAASWRYPEPYASYDLDPWDRNVVAALLREQNQYHAILRDDETVGFYCLGEDARIPGWDYDASALDLGMGLRPDITGQGQGSLYMAAVVFHLRQQKPGVTIRASVASWNHRAIRLCESAGFQLIAKFTATRKSRTEYLVLALKP